VRRPGRRYAVALLVVGRSEGLWSGSIRRPGTGSSVISNYDGGIDLRLGPGARETAMHGKAQRLGVREDPKAAGGVLRR